jgi:hypothetical protein
MARPIQLQPGQINPQAQPVSTFVQPGQKDTIKAARPQLLPQPGQLNTIATGGVGQVAGENSFRRLAQDLEAFNPQLMKTSEAAGLKYVDWRMDVGEAMAMEQVQRGLAQVDEQTEVAGDQRAADNRRLSAIDPQAGWLMRTLDPYQQMGYERGKVKMAGQQIALGLPAYIQQNQSKINPLTNKPYVDYSAPDMGMSGLQQLQAQFQLGIEEEYGINSSSPGYQKYFAPNLLRAQGQVAQQVMDDRTRFFESQIGPAAITATKDMLEVVSSDTEPFVNQAGVSVPFMVQGVDGKYEVNNQWVVGRAYNVSEYFKKAIARAPLGMSAEIAQDLYVQLASQYPEGSIQRKILDAVQGPDGKTFGERFGYLAREANVKYAKDEAQLQTNRDKIVDRQFEDILRIQLDSGQTVEEASTAAVRQLNGERQEQGLPPLTTKQKRRLEANAVRGLAQISPQAAGAGQGQLPPTDPRAATAFITQLQTQDLFEIDVDAARNQLANIGPYVPADRLSDYSAASVRLDQASKAQRERGTWVGRYSNTLTQRINTLVGEDELYLEGVDKSNATDLITGEMQNRMTSALQSLRSKQDGPLTQEQIDGEFRNIWPELQKEVIDGTFKVPGYKNQPSVGETVPQPLPVQPGTSTPSVQGYDLNQLNSMPQRSLRLRDYRNLNKGPILSAKALIQVIQDAAAGRKENPAFTKAWRQSKAPNAWTFIQTQMSFYPRLGNGKGWSNQELQKAKQDLLSYAVQDANRYATVQMLQYSPALARLNNWANEIV